MSITRGSENAESTSALVEKLWATEQVRDLVMAYALAMDTRDERLMLSLWSGRSQGARLPDLDLAMVRDLIIPSWPSRGQSVMMVSNHRVMLLDASTARGTVYALVRIELGERFVEQQVAYRDEYVREDGRWLFATRRHLLAYGIAWTSNPFGGTIADWPSRQTGRGDLWSEWSETSRPSTAP